MYGSAVSLLAAVAACNAHDGGSDKTSVKIHRDTNIASYDELSDGEGDVPSPEECEALWNDDSAWMGDGDAPSDSDLSAQSLSTLDKKKKRRGLWGACVDWWTGGDPNKGDPSPGTGGSSGSTGGPGGNGSSGSSGQTGGPTDPGGPADPGGPGASGSTGAPGNECPEWNTHDCRVLRLGLNDIRFICNNAPEEDDFAYDDAAACEDGYRLIQSCLTQLARGGRGCGMRRIMLEVDSAACQACMNNFTSLGDIFDDGAGQ